MSEKEIYLESIDEKSKRGLNYVSFTTTEAWDKAKRLSEEETFGELNRLHAAPDQPDPAVLGKHSPTQIMDTQPIPDIETRHRNSDPTKPFLCSYYHDGANWSVTIFAYDMEDAKARVAKLGYLRLDGEIHATIPVKLGFMVKFMVWFKNHFR